MHRLVALLLVCAAGCAGSQAGPVPASSTASSTTSSTSSSSTTDPSGRAPDVATDETPASGQARRPVFSLVDNRVLAHLQRRGGLLLAAGTAGFAKYTGHWPEGSSWVLGQTQGGVPVAQARHLAALQVPLTASQAETTRTIAIRVHAAGPSRLAVVINGKDRGKLGARVRVSRGRAAFNALQPGWQVIRVPVASGQLRAGENRLELRTRGKRIAVAWILIGGDADKIAEDAGPVATRRPPRGAPLALPDNGGLVYHVHVPGQSALTATLARSSCAISVVATTHDESRVTGTLTPGETSAIDFSPLGGKVARLELTAARCQKTGLIERAALTVPGSAPDLQAIQRGPAPKYVVLWVMDTLRADYLSLFNPGAIAEIPTWKRLAESGVVFTRTYSQGPESQAGHGAIFTGLYSIQHGMGWKRRHRMAPSLTRLGTTMKDAGFFTAGVTGNGYVTERGGFGVGFDVFHNLMREGGRDRYNGAIPAAKMLARAMESIRDQRDRPFFLFLGTIDTHKPWIAYEPWISKYDDPSYRGPFRRAATGGNLRMANQKGCRWEPPKRDLERIKALYASDVSYQDRHVGELLDTLEEWGIADQTMIILTADHGEELWEHGQCGHGYDLHEPQLHIPMLIHYPPLFPRARVTEGVELVDVFPTILDALGRDVPSTMAGQSLRGLAHGVGRGYPRPTFAALPTGSYALRLDRWKISWKLRGPRRTQRQFFDMTGDPGEENDLTGARPIEHRFVLDAMTILLTYRSQWSKSRWGVASNMSPAAAAALDALVIDVARDDDEKRE